MWYQLFYFKLNVLKHRAWRIKKHVTVQILIVWTVSPHRAAVWMWCHVCIFLWPSAPEPMFDNSLTRSFLITDRTTLCGKGKPGSRAGLAKSFRPGNIARNTVPVRPLSKRGVWGSPTRNILVTNTWFPAFWWILVHVNNKLMSPHLLSIMYCYEPQIKPKLHINKEGDNTRTNFWPIVIK